MAMAVAASKKSKDPRCKVGAVVVRDNTIATTGFNGFARDVIDSMDLLANVDEKLRWMCHAEFNAILNAARNGVALLGTRIYVTKFPCFSCCNAIIQAGIESIYTLDTKFWDDDPVDGDHSRKKAALAQARIGVVAPNHVFYSPKPSPKLTAVSSTPRKNKRTRSKPKSKGVDGVQLGVFPARNPVPGGKNEE